MDAGRPPGAVDGAITARQLAVVNRIARIAAQDLELRPMLQRIVDALREAFGWEFVSYASVDRATGRFVCDAVASELPSAIFVGYSRELGSGVVGTCMQRGEPMLIDDVRQWPDYVETLPSAASELCVPVIHGGEVIGALNLESVQIAAFHDDLPLVLHIADQIAGYVAAARRYQELARRAALLELMSSIAHRALQSDQLETVLQGIVAFVHERFRLVYCSILLATDPPGALVWSAVAGDSIIPTIPGSRWVANEGVIGRCYRAGVAQFVPDVTADPDYVMANAAVAAEFVVPVVYHDRILGVLNMEANSCEPFSVENLAVLTALADQVAGAIHIASVNQRLLETLELVAEKSEQLEDANAQLQQVNVLLERQSSQDGLTGIANRRQFDDAMAREWNRSRRRGHPLAVLMIDLDNFKAYNDGYGHVAGDECLRQAAQAFACELKRAEDVVARYGGEEFIVMLPETDIDAAERVAEHLRQVVARLALPHRFASSGQVTVSVGAASVIANDGLAPRQLVDMADKALYVAKLAGRNRVRRFGAAV